MSNTTTIKYDLGDCLADEDIKCMIAQIQALLGGGSIDIEIPDNTWCLLLKTAIEEYTYYMENWLLKNQWGSLANKGLNVTDVCYALTTRSLDFSKQFANAYSAEVGLQAAGTGKYELKKDFIQLSPNKQVYEVPAGREINEVMWTDQSTIPFAMSNAKSGIGIHGNAGNGYGYGSQGSLYNQSTEPYYIVPAYDTVLRAADYRLKQKFLGYEPYYKVTEGANGKKYIHLINGHNGSSLSATNCGGCNKCNACSKVSNCKVFYHYYDTSSMDEDQAAACLEECKSIVKYPFQVPLEETNFCDLNRQSKTWVRKYLTALIKESLGNIRGKFGGSIPIPDAELQMDYSHFFSEAQTEKEALNTELQDFLENLTSTAQLTKQAEEADAVAEIMKHVPTGMFTK